MGFLMPNLPEADPQPQSQETLDDARRRELAIQRARRRQSMASRENLTIDPGLRSGNDNGLAIRR